LCCILSTLYPFRPRLRYKSSSHFEVRNDCIQKNGDAVNKGTRLPMGSREIYKNVVDALCCLVFNSSLSSLSKPHLLSHHLQDQFIMPPPPYPTMCPLRLIPIKLRLPTFPRCRNLLQHLLRSLHFLKHRSNISHPLLVDGSLLQLWYYP
jgi:hypothetical protein